MALQPNNFFTAHILEGTHGPTYKIRIKSYHYGHLKIIKMTKKRCREVGIYL